MNIIKLAYTQLEREGLLNSKNEDLLLLDRAIKIRKHFDIVEENASQIILHITKIESLMRSIKEL